jgi:hypothetical protein
MFTTEETNELKKALPYRGIQMICNRTGVSRPTIYRFLEGADVGIEYTEKIWKEGWSIIRELKEKRAELKKHAQEVINFKC